MVKLAIAVALLISASAAHGQSYGSYRDNSSSLPDYSVIAGVVPVPRPRPAHPSKPLRITYDLGGAVQRYMAIAQDLGNRRVIVDGACVSSCLLLLKNNACATSDGVIGWHQARDLTTDKPRPDATSFLLHQYSKRLRDYILAHGGMKEEEQYAPALDVLPPC